jgi:hypothetical protein
VSGAVKRFGLDRFPVLPALVLLLAVGMRVLPHPPNVTPVGASAVFAGRTLKPWQSMVFVALAMALGDLALSRLHGYAVFTWVSPFVYAGFFAQAALGRALRKKRFGALGAAFAGGMAFFLLSNVGVFLSSGMYPHTGTGLVECFAQAIPFYGRTLAGDLAFTALFALGYRPLASRLEGTFRPPVPLAELGTL